MRKVIIKTVKPYVPVVYAYTTPEIAKHNGCTKIGDTYRQTEERINEQSSAIDVDWILEWKANAVYEGTNEVFRDYDFHAYLEKLGYERLIGKNYKGKEVKKEWFRIIPTEAKNRFYEFRENKGIINNASSIPYALRDSQIDAVDNTFLYFNQKDGQSPEFLWNAKPRFGKTLATYDLCKKMNFEKILIVTNRPAIANSWYQDYEKYMGVESGYYFVSNSDALKNKKYVVSRSKYLKYVDDKAHKGCIEFVSLQDLKGAKCFGGQYDKLEEIANLEWDILIIDEAHEGVDTYKTDIAFDHINRKYTLHLSGTPFKALANEKFEKDAIYNWTYADEQKAKRDWDDDDRANPYVDLPKLNLLTYKMSDIVFDKVAQGADFDDDGDNEAYAFDLNEFFITNESGNFIHDKDVDKFLNALTTQTKFPFSTEELRNELKHTLWILKYVSSAKALAKKLKDHKLFKEYKIILAAGDGVINDDDDEIDFGEIDRTIKKSYDKVIKAIAENEKTITISVGQLTTGITVPEWTGVMMLSNMKSPALYMQAAFRAQNPCLFNIDGKLYSKENSYVFDFDPARTLDIFEQFANGLSDDTVNGRGDTETRKQHIRELLNFFPVYGEDEDGEMIELDAEKVLSIPREIHAKEVVKRGFMSNFLFQNISGIFSAPSVVKSIIDKLEPVNQSIQVGNKTKDELNINDDGDIEISESKIIGTAKEIFGEKIYSNTDESISSVISNSEFNNSNSKEDALKQLKEIIHTNTDEIVNTAKENYGKEMTKSTQNEITRTINREADKEIEKHFGEYNISKNLIEADREKAIKLAKEEGRYNEIEKINSDFEEKQKQNNRDFEKNILNAIHLITENGEKTAVEVTETDIKRREKEKIEEKVRNHLRGFSRTIPSFLMGYGDDNTTLENFDVVIPKEVFLEVTGISVEDFRFLRDGGEYPDPEDENKMKHFDGNLFEPIVFNDSVKEFLRKREALADYFEEDAKEDIFDYIPPQKTNQIYTPKKVVKQMVDYLEEEDPNCFDNPEATFIDLYMKSGLYITEIVKRLYRSKKMIELYPNDDERLKHIFENQVYGCAPTEIIYAISTHYILGFSKNKDIKISSKHFKLFDALPSSQAGTLEEDLDKIFNE